MEECTEQPTKTSQLIHSTAIIDPRAELDSSVQVGPYAIIGPDVKIGKDSQVRSHAVVRGPTTLGERNQVFQFASVGEDCQDKKYKGEPTQLIIGDENIIRESVTINRGTVQDQGITQIGHRNLIMAYTHIGHDCIVGSDCVFANYTGLAGHVVIGDKVILGGFSAIHQFCSIGSFAMTGMCSAVNMDIPAFVRVQGNMAKVQGLNLEGMKRRGWEATTVQTITQAFKIVYRQNYTLAEAQSLLDTLAKQSLAPEASQALALFIESIKSSRRGLLR